MQTRRHGKVVRLPVTNRRIASRQGEYGVPAYDRTVIHMEAMLRGIERELHDATSFTRDDLMYLTCFASVATITRYSYVCRAVRYALDAGKLLDVRNHTLILAGTKRKYLSILTISSEYDTTIIQMVQRCGGSVFGVHTLVDMWTTDTHLSVGGKRTIVREALRRLTKKEYIEVVGMNEFQRKGV